MLLSGRAGFEIRGSHCIDSIWNFELIYQEENYSSKSGSVNSRTSHASEASASSVQHVDDSTLTRPLEQEIPTIAMRHVVRHVILTSQCRH